MNWRNLFLVALMLGASVSAREWRSVDGSRTVEAEFAGMKEGRLLLKGKDGKSTVFPATAFSKEDQQFAQQAQVTLEAAVKAKPLNFEVNQMLPEGFLCRVVSEMPGQKGLWMASGASFLVLPAGDVPAERGARVMAKTLYHAGTRTYQALDGTTSLINAYSLDLDEAVQASLQILAVSGGDPAKQAPLIVEPLMEKVVVRGLGLPLGKGYFITDAAFAEGKHPVAIHHEGKDVPANVVKLDSKRGLALLQCTAIPTQAGTFLARDGATFGQGIFVASMTLNPSRRGFEPVTLTTGIVGRLIDSARFQHDAPLVPDAVGGFVLSERMEVLGVFFSPETRSLGKQSSAASAGAPPAPRGITECHRSELLDELLGDSSKGKRLPGVPELRRGSLGSDKQGVADLLRKSCALVVSTREIMKTPPVSTVDTGKPAGAGAGGGGGGNAPGPGKSLSSSGIRHNAGCRYFNAAKPCQPGEGTPCKICGG